MLYEAHGAAAAHLPADNTRPRSGADMIVFHARIFTGNLAQPDAPASAAKGGPIYAVDTDAEILGRGDTCIKMIEAGGRRRERTCKMLEMTDLPVTEFALGVGYSSNQVFAPVFVKHWHLSPTDFRRSVRQ